MKTNCVRWSSSSCYFVYLRGRRIESACGSVCRPTAPLTNSRLLDLCRRSLRAHCHDPSVRSRGHQGACDVFRDKTTRGQIDNKETQRAGGRTDLKSSVPKLNCTWRLNVGTISFYTRTSGSIYFRFERDSLINRKLYDSQ